MAANTTFQTATSDYRASVAEAVESSARGHNLRVHPDSVSILVHDAIPGTGAVACAAVEGVHELSVDELFGGSKPALLIYLPTSTLVSGPTLEEGVYAAVLDASQGTASLRDAAGNHVADVSMETGLVPANDYLAEKLVVTDIGEITLCRVHAPQQPVVAGQFGRQFCVRVCYSIEIEGPLSFTVRAKICLEIIIHY